MYVKRPLIMKSPVTVPEKNGLKPSIDAFLDLLISSGKESFEADLDFGFSLEDYRFEIYNPEIGLFTSASKKGKKDIIGTIEDPLDKYRISGSSLSSFTFANDLKETIDKYEHRLKKVEVGIDFAAKGSILLISVKGIIDDGYDTPYTYITKIRIW